jgi:hypothetical protein
MQAAWHMRRFGTTQAQIAFAASKNHAMGALNPKAQYRFELSPEQVLADRLVSWPLTRAMCSPIGDGAAAALLCSEKVWRSLPAASRERAVQVKASVLTGGKYRALDEPGLSRLAAQRAYAAAGVQPSQIDVAEVHDATFAAVSHLPHLLAFAAVNALTAQPQGAAFLDMAGPGFRDFSRIAASDAAVWRDILSANQAEVLTQVAHFRAALDQFENALKQGDTAALQGLIQQASEIRSAWTLNTGTADDAGAS